jgi:hypothetical protein
VCDDSSVRCAARTSSVRNICTNTRQTHTCIMAVLPKENDAATNCRKIVRVCDIPVFGTRSDAPETVSSRPDNHALCYLRVIVDLTCQISGRIRVPDTENRLLLYCNYSKIVTHKIFFMYLWPTY